MYAWYRDAGICWIYLDEVPPGASVEVFEESRWFRRGWTLQELIAPRERLIVANDWTESEISKQVAGSAYGRDNILSKITGIPPEVLQHKQNFESHCIAERMSWAARRQTTRPEDKAYGLMGIFDVNIPILYGEGLGKAFMRLQKEIMQNSFDQSIFAWRGPYYSSGLLAQTPDDFANSAKLSRLYTSSSVTPFTMTNIGLHVTLSEPDDHDVRRSVAPQTEFHKSVELNVVCHVNRPSIIVLRLAQLPGGFSKAATGLVNGKELRMYRRVDCDAWDYSDSSIGANLTSQHGFLVLQDETWIHLA